MNNKIIIWIVYTVFMATHPITAQSTNTWFNSYGGTGTETPPVVVEAPSGDLYITYSTNNSPFSYNIVLMKCTNSGTVLWQKVIGLSTQDEIPHGMVLGSDSYLYISASINGYSNNGIALILKSDTSGGIRWMKTYDGQFTEKINHLIYTYDNCLMVAGKVSFSTSGSCFFMKLDTAGLILYQKKTMPISNTQSIGSVVETPGGNYVFSMSVNYQALLALFKFSVSGNYIWGYSYDDGLNPVMSATPDNGFVIASQSSMCTNGLVDVVVMRTDSNGGPMWRKAYGNALNNDFKNIYCDDDTTIIVAGTTYYPNSFPSDIFVLKLKPNGDTIRTSIIGSTDSDIMDEPNTVVKATDGYLFPFRTYSSSPDAGLIKTDLNGQMINCMPPSTNYGILNCPMGGMNEGDPFIYLNTFTLGNASLPVVPVTLPIQAICLPLNVESAKNEPENIAFPNPCSEFIQFTLDNNFTGVLNLIISNTLGQMVLSEKFTSKEFKVTTSDLIPGMYFYEIRSGSKSHSGKFVKR